MHYESVFDKELATLKNVEVTLKVKSDAIPKFCTTHPISYALKYKVEKKLECLVTEGIPTTYLLYWVDVKSLANLI